MGKDFIVVSTFEGLVPEKVGFLEVFPFQVPETVRLIPSCRKYIKRYLTSDRIRESVVWKLFFERSYEDGPNIVLLVIDFKFFALSMTKVSASNLQFLPIGLTLIMPFLNSINVPRFTGISKAAMYCRIKLTRAL